MTVGELIKKLQQYDKDWIVNVPCNPFHEGITTEPHIVKMGKDDEGNQCLMIR